MEYVKTFIVLVVFLFLSFGCIANIIIHRDERKAARKKAKEEKKKAKEERKWKRRARLMGINVEPEKPTVVREYDLDEDEADEFTEDNPGDDSLDDYLTEDTEEPSR